MGLGIISLHRDFAQSIFFGPQEQVLRVPIARRVGDEGKLKRHRAAARTRDPGVVQRYHRHFAVAEGGDLAMGSTGI